MASYYGKYRLYVNRCGWCDNIGMNSETLFSMALGLQTPWHVRDVTFSADELARSELHLRIGFASGSRFPDETNELCPVHDTINQWGQTRLILLFLDALALCILIISVRLT
jgi:hypothetical protein